MAQMSQGKYFDVGLKNGWSYSDFIADLQLGNEDDLIIYIENSFNAKNARTIKNRLERNKKLKRKISKNNTAKNDEVSTIKAEGNTTETNALTLESLKESETALKQLIVSLEKEREQWKSKRFDIFFAGTCNIFPMFKCIFNILFTMVFIRII